MQCSTVIPTFNRRNTVGNAIRSALTTLPDGEVIVVDDASTDGTTSQIRTDFPFELSAAKLRVVVLSQNSGVTAAKNAGYAAARFPWVIFLDSDDHYYPGVGPLLLEEFASNRTRPILFFRCVDEEGRFVGKREGEHLLLDLRLYLRHTSFGEALTAVNKGLIGAPPPYVDELRGYEGIGCCRLIKRYGPALLSAHVARVYDRSGADRLSTWPAMKRRLSSIARGHVLMLHEFGSSMPISKFVTYALKALIYGVTAALVTPLSLRSK